MMIAMNIQYMFTVSSILFIFIFIVAEFYKLITIMWNKDEVIFEKIIILLQYA